MRSSNTCKVRRDFKYPLNFKFTQGSSSRSVKIWQNCGPRVCGPLFSGPPRRLAKHYAARGAVVVVVGGGGAKQLHHDAGLRANAHCSDQHLAAALHHVRPCASSIRRRCKKNVFLFCPRFLRFWRFVLFSKRFFLFSENVGKVQSGKQINNKHFQNNSNEIDLWFFCFMSNDLRCLPINVYLLTMEN